MYTLSAYLFFEVLPLSLLGFIPSRKARGTCMRQKQSDRRSVPQEIVPKEQMSGEWVILSQQERHMSLTRAIREGRLCAARHVFIHDICARVKTFLKNRGKRQCTIHFGKSILGSWSRSVNWLINRLKHHRFMGCSLICTPCPPMGKACVTF